MSLRPIAGGLALLSFMVVVGCSDDGGSKTLSRAEYITAGDALCQRFLDKTDAFPDPETPEQLAELLDQAIPLAEEIRADLVALKPPPEADDVHSALVSALDGSTAKVKEAQEALETGDIEAVGAAMDQAVEIGQESDQPAKDFGFQVCGSESELSGG